jgi:hypothetical protein
MFSFGYLGLLAAIAAPLLFVYAAAILFIIGTAKVLTRISELYSIKPHGMRLLKYCLLAWIFSLILFCGLGAIYVALEYTITGTEVIRAYPIAALLLLFLPLFLELRESVIYKSSGDLAPQLPRTIISVLLALFPVLTLVAFALVRR